MKTRASTSLSAESKRTVPEPRPVNFTIFNPAGAKRQAGTPWGAPNPGQAPGNQSGANRLPLLPPAHKAVCSSQSGIGSTSNSNQVLKRSGSASRWQCPEGETCSARRARARFDSTTNTATDAGVAESAGVNLVSGLVTAGRCAGSGLLHKPLASTRLSVRRDRHSTNLVVNGTQLNNVNPNTTINLPAAQFGAGQLCQAL